MNITSAPLLYQAAKAGIYGKCYVYPEGSITDAMFVFLDGLPSPESIDAVANSYRMRAIVCLSDEWEAHIKDTFPNVHVLKRYMMNPARDFDFNCRTDVPDGFEATLFDEQAFELHPFSHGEYYKSFSEFQKLGAGAVVRHAGKIVASASSFISCNNEVELDVSTDEAYRGKGLASACIALMLKDCTQKGLTVHWDAQNDTSLHLAEKFGFELDCCYDVYVIPA